MSQYIVFGRENHPDKFLTDFYGGHRLYSFTWEELVAPSPEPKTLKLKKLAALFADRRVNYYGYDEIGYHKHQAYESIRDEVLGILGD